MWYVPQHVLNTSRLLGCGSRNPHLAICGSSARTSECVVMLLPTAGFHLGIKIGRMECASSLSLISVSQSDGASGFVGDGCNKGIFDLSTVGLGVVPVVSSLPS